MNISFSVSTLTGFFITGAVYFLLPAAAFFFLKKYKAAQIYPVIVGAVFYFLSTRISDILSYIFGFSMSFANKSVIAAELVCIFEETARWLAMKYPVTNIHSTRSAVCYGIGHAGLECWIRGFQSFQIFAYGQRLNNSGIESFVSGMNDEKASAVTEQLKAFADHSLFLSFFDLLILLTGFGFHIALSVLIFKKINCEKRWLFLAILLHYCLNCSAWLASLSGSPIFSSITSITVGIVIIFIAAKIINLKECIDEILYPLDNSVPSE